MPNAAAIVRLSVIRPIAFKPPICSRFAFNRRSRSAWLADITGIETCRTSGAAAALTPGAGTALRSMDAGATGAERARSPTATGESEGGNAGVAGCATTCALGGGGPGGGSGTPTA